MIKTKKYVSLPYRQLCEGTVSQSQAEAIFSAAVLPRPHVLSDPEHNMLAVLPRQRV